MHEEDKTFLKFQIFFRKTFLEESLWILISDLTMSWLHNYIVLIKKKHINRKYMYFVSKCLIKQLCLRVFF